MSPCFVISRSRVQVSSPAQHRKMVRPMSDHSCFANLHFFMEISLTTPALLFPALSLLLLAYTNRFLALARLARELHTKYQEKNDPLLKVQILSLQSRIKVIKNTQVFGVASFFGGVLCMFFQYAGFQYLAVWTFGFSLVLMLLSLALSLKEVYMSLDTLSLLLSDVNQKENK